MNAEAIQALAVREVATLVRSRTPLLLLAGVVVVVFGMGTAGGGIRSGYLPTAIDLLLPLELLVPALAVALGYPPLVGDTQRGELEVFATYPLAAWEYVLGVFVGRALGLVALVVAPLALVAAGVALGGDGGGTLAVHSGVDSPLLFARFVVLTCLFALAVLAAVLAVTALAASRSSAVVLSILAMGVVVVGLDLLLLRGFGAGLVADSSLSTALAVSPTSAYRGLVFQTVVSTALDSQRQFASPAASLAGLTAWTLVSLAVTALAVEQ